MKLWYNAGLKYRGVILSMEESPVFEYAVEQKTFEIGGVKIGGVPGRYPTVLVSSIFYSKDKLVINEIKGEFDRKKAEDSLAMLADISGKTGNPTMLDVVASTPEAVLKYLEFLVDATEFPLIIDGSDSPEVNSAGLNYTTIVSQNTSPPIPSPPPNRHQ